MFSFIRKFGFGSCDLPTMMENVAILMRSLTVNIDTGHGKGISPIYYLLTIISAGCYFYIYLFSMIWFVFWRCMETRELLAALIVFSLGFASEIGPVRLIHMILQTAQIRSIVSTTLALDTYVVPGSRFSRNLMKSLRRVKRRAIIFWIIVMSNGVVYLMKPFVISGRHLMEDLFIFYGLEPMYESPNYEIAILTNIVGVMFTCYSTVNISAFVIVNTGYVEAQMLSWSKELLHLWDDAKLYSENCHQSYANNTELMEDVSVSQIKTIVINEFIQSRLKEIIEGHARNLNLLHQIEVAFRGIIAIQFFIVIIGLIAELLGGLENTYIEVPFTLIQVAIDCLTGQRLADASVEFERAVFSCRWEHFDGRNMKLVLLMLQNSQKTMTLSAGGMTKLNFRCLMSVVRSTYSAYTTLRSTMR